MNTQEWFLLAVLFAVLVAFKLWRYKYVQKLAIAGRVDSLTVWFRGWAVLGIIVCGIMSPVFYKGGHSLIAAFFLFALGANLIVILKAHKFTKWIIRIYQKDANDNSRKPEQGSRSNAD